MGVFASPASAHRGDLATQRRVAQGRVVALCEEHRNMCPNNAYVSGGGFPILNYPHYREFWFPIWNDNQPNACMFKVTVGHREGNSNINRVLREEGLCSEFPNGYVHRFDRSYF